RLESRNHHVGIRRRCRRRARSREQPVKLRSVVQPTGEGGDDGALGGTVAPTKSGRLATPSTQFPSARSMTHEPRWGAAASILRASPGSGRADLPNIAIMASL